MSDKEAIELLKEYLMNFKRMCNGNLAELDGYTKVIGIGELRALDNMLLSYEMIGNELEKKNKEIEELQESIHKERILAEVQTSYEINEMWKQKIQEKIDEIKMENQQIYINKDFSKFLLEKRNNIKIKVLQELLKRRR